MAIKMKQLKILEFDYLKIKKPLTMQEKSIFIFAGIKEHLPKLYNYMKHGNTSN